MPKLFGQIPIFRLFAYHNLLWHNFTIAVVVFVLFSFVLIHPLFNWVLGFSNFFINVLKVVIYWDCCDVWKYLDFAFYLNENLTRCNSWVALFFQSLTVIPFFSRFDCCLEEVRVNNISLLSLVSFTLNNVSLNFDI